MTAEVGIGDRHQFARADLAGQRGEAGEVGEHDRDLALLAAETQRRLAVDQLIDDRRREVMAEGVLHPAAPTVLDHEAHDIGHDHRPDRRRGRQYRRKPQPEAEQHRRRRQAQHH